MSEEKRFEYEHNKKRPIPTPEKITKWEGQTREKRRHKDMMKRIKQWERKG